MCNVKNTHFTNLLRETDLIIWDEALMNDRCCFETLDRTLRDVLDAPDVLLGGKSIMLGSDLRQTHPVKRKSSNAEMISSSIAESYFWPSFKIWWLTVIGDDDNGTPDESSIDDCLWAHMPDEMCILNDENGRLELICSIYDEHTLQRPTARELQHKSIVCPKNEITGIINTQVLSMIKRETQTYNSFDKATPQMIVAQLLEFQGSLAKKQETGRKLYIMVPHWHLVNTPSLISCLDQHAHTLHHLESLLTISINNHCLDNLDILKEDLEYKSLCKSLSLILELS
ncbi:DNA helicase [Tanacetum coccineum]